MGLKWVCLEDEAGQKWESFTAQMGVGFGSEMVCANGACSSSYTHTTWPELGTTCYEVPDVRPGIHCKNNPP
ncbi:hypothetical protein CTI12_AA157630 [Artemisia annua]|uniref:Uncharacterized protein n=1 Tax=Artemisia annua TaxID=35608 RepID=A0A2U1PG97_ARTAN|nr:hypothetical protein CTI12_AA157630 [Artemisia annua]